MPICTICKKDKPSEAFHVRDDNSKLRSEYKQCYNIRANKWYHKNKLKISEERKRRRTEDPAWKDLENARQRESNRRNPGRQAARDRKYNYGINDDEYQTLGTQQSWKCAICGYSAEDKKAHHRKSLDTDHDKLTGKVRGLLCSPCNMGLGKFEHDLALLEAAIIYLRSSE